MTSTIDSERAVEDTQAPSTATILIVDDDIGIRANVHDLLEISGYQVLSAPGGLEALGVMERTSPDLIISDINMPSMDGYAFFKSVRANPAWTLIPFIFLTARGQPQEVRRGISLGVDQYLVKPFQPEDLLVAVEARLKRIREIEDVTHNDVESMKSRLMTMFSHELRTPLTYIYGYVSLLHDEHAELGVDEREEMIRVIQRGADRLTHLVEDLLLVARLESGEARLEIGFGRKEVTVDSLVSKALKDMEHAIEDRQTIVETQIPPNISLSCDPNHLSNTLGRLIDNAVKFTKSPNGHVWVAAAIEGDTVRISVQDDGIGVSSAKQKLLFQPLHQIDRAQHEQQGIGVGLVIAQGIVAEHGGHIEVTSEGIPGHGSIFTIVLPQAMPGDAAAA